MMEMISTEARQLAFLSSLTRSVRFFSVSSKMTIASIPLISSSKSAKMPQLGLGTWKAGTGVVADIVEKAIVAGYTSLDCACDYGNETEVGQGIKAGLAATEQTREKLFVTSKLWNTYHRPEHVLPAAKRSLQDLDLEYLDLYMIHFPISLQFVPFEKRYPPEWLHDPDTDPTLRLDPVPLRETWNAMEKLVDEGLVRHLGVCNFPVSLLMDLLSYARIKPSVLQVELHPYLQQPRLLEICRREGIAVTAFSPFGAASYVSLNMDKGDNLLGDPVMSRIAGKHRHTPAQVALRWAVQRGTAVIPKTSRAERLSENMDVFSWELTDEDMKEIEGLDRGKRYNDPGEFCVGMGMSVPIYD